MSFFILGLPRSRTAWLANLMSYDGYHCHHEGSNNCYKLEEYKAKLGPCTGDANTGLVLIDIKKHFPDSKIVIIDSTIDEAVAYGQRVHKANFTKGLTVMKAKLDKLEGLHIPIADIDDHLEDIWEYLTHGIPFNPQRANLLKGLNINVKEPYLINVRAARSFYSDCE